MYRIGYAEDIHKLVKGRNLILGGVKIPFKKGFDAHSDGDIVYHAVCESILGALAKGDLGVNYPNTNPKYKDIDSSFFVKDVFKKMEKDHYHISNIDVSIILEEPIISSYLNKIEENLIKLLKIEKGKVSIKANTNEGLGDIGKGKAGKAVSVVLLKKD